MRPRSGRWTWSLLLAGLAVIAACVALAPSSAGPVSPNADVYVTNLNVDGVPDRVDDRNVWAVLLPTEDSPGGEVDLVLRVEVEHHNGTGPTTTIEENRTVDVPPPEERERYPVLAEPSFDWKPSAGMYRVTLQLFERTAAGERVFWAEDTVLHRVGTGPDLRHGWGSVDGRGPEVSLLGDGRADVRMTNTTSEPEGNRSWSLKAAAQPWESNAAYGWELRLTLRPPEPGARTTLEVAEESLRTILQASEDETLAFDGDDAYSRQGSRDGWILYEVNTTDPDHRGYHTLRVESETQRPIPRTWFDGYNNRFNLTAWDVTGDRRGDLSFWETTADSPAQALNESLEERRTKPVQIVGDVTVVGGNETFRIQLDLRRADGDHEGVWLEVNETAIGQTLALGDEAPRSLAYNLSLAPENQLVERADGSAWLWIGHFSTQHVEILVNDPDQVDEETPGPHTNGTEDPSGDDQPRDGRHSDDDPQLEENGTSEDRRGTPVSPWGGILASTLAAALGAAQRLERRP